MKLRSENDEGSPKATDNRVANTNLQTNTYFGYKGSIFSLNIEFNVTNAVFFAVPIDNQPLSTTKNFGLTL